VATDDIYRISQLFISEHLFDEIKFVVGPIIERVDFDLFETVSI